MFQYVYPQFEKKRLLRVEMLDQLRDNPKDYLQLSYLGYSDGIVSGCKVSWDEGRLTLLPGIVWKGGNLYFMKEPYTVDCQAENQVRYLKIQFLTEVREVGKVMGNTRILLDAQEADPACEIELCRFRLQEGARLRGRHESFEDYATEYDTINLIHVPFAGEGRSTLMPCILKQFAIETIRNRVQDPYDVGFAMNVMANSGMVSPDCVREYLNVRLDGLKMERNQDVYRGLLKVLREQEYGGRKAGTERMEQKKVLLM